MVSNEMTSRYLSVNPQSALPLAAQLSSQFTWLIARGELAPGDTLPPIRALATDLDINFNTVRAAYKQLEADGLVTPQRGRGTTVIGYERGRHQAGRSSLRTFTIGVIVPSHSPFYVPFLNALESASTDPSLLFVCVAREDPARGLAYLDQLVAKDVDGVLVAGAMIPSNTELDGRGHTPVVFVDYPGAPGPSVGIDHEAASALVTTHLLEHGHRRIGLVAPPRELPNIAPKYAGYERAVRDVAGSVGLIEAVPDFSGEAGYQGAMRLLTQDEPPTALVAVSDTLAVGVMLAAKDLGVSIPRQVALVGSDNIEFADFLDPPLTSINVPTAEMGLQAMAMLEQLILDQPLENENVVLPTELVIRQSCGCPSVTGAAVTPS